MYMQFRIDALHSLMKDREIIKSLHRVKTFFTSFEPKIQAPVTCTCVNVLICIMGNEIKMQARHRLCGPGVKLQWDR